MVAVSEAPLEVVLPEPMPLRLTKAAAQEMAKHLTKESVRWLVDTYYQIQEFRKAAGNQTRAASDTTMPDEAGEPVAEPSPANTWVYDQMAQTEAGIKRVMDAWTDLSRPGRWLKSQVGIGPVLAAGLLATFDEFQPTVGHWWRFAGLDPTAEWLGTERAAAVVRMVAAQIGDKDPVVLARAVAVRINRNPENFLRLATDKDGRVSRATIEAAAAKRPFSAKAKVLCWKVGDSFVKVSNRPDAFYGQLYRGRKAYELQRDTTGGNAATAKATLETKRLQDKATIAKYEAGHLPDGRLDLRARRYAAKMLLAHLHWVVWEDRTGSPPPAGPYAIDILKHAHLIAPPNWPVD